MPSISLVELQRGVVLQSFDGDSRIYFPVTCVFSISAQIPGVPRTFIRFAGGNLAVGFSRILSAGATVYDAQVVGRGYTYVVPESQLLKLFSSDESLRLWQQAIALSASEMALVVGACVSVHTTSQRLARLLLEASDAFGLGRAVTLTQAELACRLAVTRESVTLQLNQWCRAGLLTHQRGQIFMVDRERVLDIACHCYAAVHELEARMLQRWKDIKWRELPVPQSHEGRANRMSASRAVRRV